MNQVGQLKPVIKVMTTSVKLLGPNNWALDLVDEDLLKGQIYGVVVRANDTGYDVNENGASLVPKGAMGGMILELQVAGGQFVKIPLLHLLKDNLDHLYAEVDWKCVNWTSSKLHLFDQNLYDATRGDDAAAEGQVVEFTWFYC